MLRKILAGEVTQDDFTADFLNAVPLSRLQALAEQVNGVIGPVAAIEVAGREALVSTATHQVNVQITLDSAGRVAGLFVQPPEALLADLPEAEAELRALGDQVAWLVVQAGEVLAERDADQPISVASAFKIGVLSVLTQDIADGTRAWSDVVTLDEQYLSLPSGVMQSWPVCAPVTLHTAALQMISISDNTATDLLIGVVGAARVAEALGLETLPSTKAFFASKGATEAGDALPMFTPGDGWNVSLRRLCALALPLADLDLMQVNPGVLSPARFGRVAHKGGSVPGVLSFVTVLPEASGGPACVALAINHSAEVELLAASGAYRAFANIVLAPR